MPSTGRPANDGALLRLLPVGSAKRAADDAVSACTESEVRTTGGQKEVASCHRPSHPTPIVPSMSQLRPWRAVDPDLFRFTTTELRDLHIGLMSAFDQAAIVAPALNLDQVRGALRTVGWEEWVDDASLQRALAALVGWGRLHHSGGVRAEEPPVVAHATRRGGDRWPPPRPRQSPTRGRTATGGPRRHRGRSG